MRESLRRKHTARVAAVQALYSYAISEHKPSPEKLVEQLKAQWKESVRGADPEWPADDLPEQTMLSDVITGTISHLQAVDDTLASVIKENWKSERMDPVMLAILRCATFELAFRQDRKLPVLLDEYVTIAGGYFDGSELGYVHSALQTLAPLVRSDKKE